MSEIESESENAAEPKPNRGRAALFALLSISLASGLGLLTARRDLETLIGASFGLALVALALLLAASVLNAFEREARRIPLALLAFGAALLVAFIPFPEMQTLTELGPLPRHTLAASVPCAPLGVAIASLVFVLLRIGGAQDRLLAIVAGGLAANLALLFHCPSGDSIHRLLTHAGLFALLGISLAIALGVEKRLAPKALNHQKS